MSTRICLTTDPPNPPCHDYWIGDYPNLMSLAEDTYNKFLTSHCKIVFDDKYAEALLQYLNYLALCMTGRYGSNLLELLSHTYFYKPMKPTMEPTPNLTVGSGSLDGTKGGNGDREDAMVPKCSQMCKYCNGKGGRLVDPKPEDSCYSSTSSGEFNDPYWVPCEHCRR